MRLNKFLASCGVSSRRGADELITAGKVQINGKTVRELGTKVDPDKDKVTLDGQRLESSAKKVIYLFNKPKGVVTTADDPEGRKTVLDFVPNTPRVFPCGRLDYDTMGLVILTNDGNLCYQLTHPKFEHQKEYIVEGTTKTPKAALTELEQDKIILKDGPVTLDELKLIKMKKDTLSFLVTIHEGRNHLVRRICAAVGIEVVNLTRIRVGQYELGDLKPGEYKQI
ncbi:MAG: rRNA pseudouridine synthase [Candidatus Berkelbacteria bacterium]|nr:MAG: rRNA pseudouridine synthase [Candidatus Berkelbacteria bacterium]QQG51972.1 MAG: rRNA pseudouridine synthase [Candidatus Berkelbacteria bacterium]